MEKALLKVTRFNSADVIATSGSSGCSNHVGHFWVQGETSINGIANWQTLYYDKTTKQWDPNIVNKPKAILPEDTSVGSIIASNGTSYEICTSFNP